MVPAATATAVYRTTTPATSGLRAACWPSTTMPIRPAGRSSTSPSTTTRSSDQATERLLLQNAVNWLTGTDSTDVPTGRRHGHAAVAGAGAQPVRPGALVHARDVRPGAGRARFPWRSTTWPGGRCARSWSPRPRTGGPRPAGDSGMDGTPSGRDVGAGTYWIRLECGGREDFAADRGGAVAAEPLAGRAASQAGRGWPRPLAGERSGRLRCARELAGVRPTGRRTVDIGRGRR